MTNLRTTPNRLAGAGLLSAGLVLFVNPAYLGALSIYPGTGWTFLPLFHAALSALGLLAVASGWFLLRSARPAPLELAVLAGVTVVAVPLYGSALVAILGADGSAFSGYGGYRSFVAALVATSYALGFGIVSRSERAVLVGVATPLAPLVLVIVRWPSGALLEPILELHFLLTGGPLLGIPYLGALVILGAGALGSWLGSAAGSDSIDPA